jgi:hypothetical protein
MIAKTPTNPRVAIAESALKRLKKVSIAARLADRCLAARFKISHIRGISAKFWCLGVGYA